MKKLISLILVLCMACMLIPATAEEDLTGEWYGAMMGMGLIMTVNEDGTFSMTVGGNVMGAGTWKMEDGNLLAEVDGQAETFEFKDGTLYEATSRITLTRNPEDAPAPIVIADPKTDAAAEEYYGEWTCSGLEANGLVLSAETYATNAQGDTLPGLTISDSAVEFSGDGMFATVFSMFTLKPEYADGALTATGVFGTGESSITMEVHLQILQDGSLKVSAVSNGSPMVLYFVPAAAEEVPAA